MKRRPVSAQRAACMYVSLSSACKSAASSGAIRRTISSALPQGSHPWTRAPSRSPWGRAKDIHFDNRSGSGLARRPRRLDDGAVDEGRVGGVRIPACWLLRAGGPCVH
eukprot:10089283-Prorocentrum_lima.AAC.1